MNSENKIIIGVIAVTILVLIGGAVWITMGTPPAPQAQVEVAKTMDSKMYHRGNPSAKVKIAEFADFQCPSCAAVNPIVNDIVKEFGDKIYIETHYFPLSQHQYSQDSAEAAEAAGAQGKFFEYGDLLYAKQNEWSPSDNPRKFFVQYASELKLDTKKFEDDLNNRTYRQKVLDSLKRGNELAVSATPTFFINGKRYEGGMEKQQFESVINDLLKK